MDSARINYVKAKIQDIEQDLIEFNKQIFKLYSSKEQDIIYWADYLSELVEAGELPIKLDDISTYIRNRVRELSLDIPLNYISQVLPSKYKKAFRADNARKNEYIYESKAEEAIPEKPIAIMSNEEVRAALDTASSLEAEYSRRRNDIRQKRKELYEEARNRGIAIEKPDKETISTLKDPSISASFIAMGELAEIIGERNPKDPSKSTGLVKKLYEFPPIGEEDAALSKALETIIEFLRPLQDEKWTTSLLEWLRIEQDYIDWGKHAAGSMNATVTISGVERKLTREQVGDKFQELLATASRIIGKPEPKKEDFYKEESGFMVFDEEGYNAACFGILEEARQIGTQNALIRELSLRWHKKYAEPRIAQRKVDLHDTLSEAA